MAREDNCRIVGPHREGWQVKANGADRASFVTETKTEAVARALEILRNCGGGKLKVEDDSGRTIDSDRVEPLRARAHRRMQ
jgi:hypothetical protein